MFEKLTLHIQRFFSGTRKRKKPPKSRMTAQVNCMSRLQGEMMILHYLFLGGPRNLFKICDYFRQNMTQFDMGIFDKASVYLQEKGYTEEVESDEGTKQSITAAGVIYYLGLSQDNHNFNQDYQRCMQVLIEESDNL